MRLTIALLLVLAVLSEASAFPTDNDTYWRDRYEILHAEEKMAIGGEIVLNDLELRMNEILMGFKTSEINAGFSDPKTFLPSFNFMSKKSEIELSKTFELIKKMPKGAVLHAHEFGLVSSDWVFNEITYMPNLYLCNGSPPYMKFSSQLKLDNCESVPKLRANPKRRDVINNFIRSWLSMEVPNPDVVYSDVNSAWKKFQNLFWFLGPMLTYRPVFEKYLYQGLLELYEDNVQYLELRTVLPNLYDMDGTIYSGVQVAQIFKNISDKFVKDYPDFMGMKIIYGPDRNVLSSDCDKYLKKAKQLREALPEFVIGFDLVGQEDKGKPLTEFVKTLLTYDIPYFFHAGETDWNGVSTDQNLIDAVLLKVKRIGHGYAVLKHPQILSKLKEYNIPIEVNPISNQVLKLVSDLRNHPASFLFANNLPVVVSCDDPGLWGAKGLSYDFYEAFVGIMSLKSDLRALKMLATNSIKYSSLSKNEKKHAMQLWESKWNNFLSNGVNEYENDMKKIYCQSCKRVFERLLHD